MLSLTDPSSLESLLLAQQEALPDALLVLGAPPAARILNSNRHFREMWGLAEDDFKSAERLFEAIVAQATSPETLQKFIQTFQARPEEAHRCSFESKDGRTIDVRVQPVTGPDGVAFASLCLFRDITAHRHAKTALHESEERYRRLVEASPNMVAVYCEGRVVFLNTAGARMLGAEKPEELYGRNIMDVIHPDCRTEVAERVRELTERLQPVPLMEVKFRALDGSTVDVDVIGVPTTYQGKPAGQVVVRNITQRKRAEALAEQMAYADALTGLPNRRFFHERLDHSLSQARHRDRQLAILILDLDRFKNVNDTLGHDVGDLFLKSIAERMQACLDPKDFIARIGGDEFAIILSRVEGPRCGVSAAQNLMKALSEPFTVSGHELYVTASIGISHYPTDGAEASHLLKNADTAMYRAKGQPNSYQLYTPSMNEASMERLSLESQLHKAIERDEFILHYQPQVEIHSGRILGAEALIRWQQPELGMISPAKFIPLAEETGLIVPITDMVLRKACRQAKEWQLAGHPLCRVAVNLSGLYFKQRDVISAIAEVLAEFELPPSSLELELTESIFMEDHDATLATLRALREMGVRVSIDDFGTGYSSLSYLKRFPIGMLKIDQSFVREITSAADDAAIAQTIILLGHSLGMRVIAEGVETVEQRAFLAAHGCDEIQGYLISRPVPAEAFHRLLSAEQVLAS